jgi:hypothetical protein
LNKLCVFNKAVNCSECGVCYICDLNANKRCNNCGKCLELEGYDIKAIEIDDIFESNKDLAEFEELDDLHSRSNDELSETDEFWDYIDDIVDLKDLIENENGNNIIEEFPGLFVYNKVGKNKLEEAEGK